RGVRSAFIGVGSVGSTETRRRLYDFAHEKQLDVVTVVHPSALLSPSATYGAGLAMMAGAIVNAPAGVWRHAVGNSGAIVEHDCMIGDHVHVASGARIGGGVTIGDGAHVGIGASVRQGIVIGRGAVIGAGAAVVADVPDHAVAVGVPARILAENPA